MIRKLISPASVAAIGGIVLAIALVVFAPSARLYAPLALLIPCGIALSAWRQSADEERHRSAFDTYAFREITRMQRKRVEGW
jgi:hypothetical protein